jgi:hypothetical protein
MKHKALSIVVPVVVVAVVVGVMALFVSQDKGGADALTVDGSSVSQATINRELSAWADSGLAQTATGASAKTSSGAISSDFTAAWLTARVTAVAVDNLLERHDLRVRAQDRRDAVSSLPPAITSLPRSAYDTYITALAGYGVLTASLGDPSSALTREMRRLDVSVAPKYGRWARARGEVCTWTHCVVNSPSSSSTG